MSGADAFTCPQCGQYALSDIAEGPLTAATSHRGVLSGAVRREYEANNRKPVMITLEKLHSLLALGMPTFKERINEYLASAAQKATMLNQGFDYVAPEMRAAAYCHTQDELKVITDYLVSEEYLRPLVVGGSVAQLLPKGHLAADELRIQFAASMQGFIAMWFDAAMEDARRNGLEAGVRRAGYKPHRVDAAQHIDKIDDRIIADIRRSKFVVADLTGHRGGVYYEAGFALGLNKPVFYSCREDHRKDIHFDVRQFNCIIWKEPAELANDLATRIEAVIGRGPDR